MSIMELTQQEKDTLKAFKLSEAYKILKKIEQEQFSLLGQVLLRGDLTDPKFLEEMKTQKVYVKARKEFLENVNKHCKGIFAPKI